MSINSARVLIAGTNHQNLKLLSRFINDLGYESIEAVNIEELNRAIQTENINLALIDIAGFNQSIWNSCAELEKKQTPFFIIISGPGKLQEHSRMLHGAKGVLVKPLVMKELAGLIRGLL